MSIEPSPYIEAVDVEDPASYLGDILGRDQLFAVADGCVIGDLRQRAQLWGEEKARCLYDCSHDPSLADAAPYLVHVDDAEFLWISEALSDLPWGVYVISDRELDALTESMARISWARSPSGRELAFRFYDPRVLQPVLSVLEPAQLLFTFESVWGFGVLSAQGKNLELLRPADGLKTDPREGKVTELALTSVQWKLLSPRLEPELWSCLVEMGRTLAEENDESLRPEVLEDRVDHALEMGGLLGMEEEEHLTEFFRCAWPYFQGRKLEPPVPAKNALRDERVDVSERLARFAAVAEPPTVGTEESDEQESPRVP